MKKKLYLANPYGFSKQTKSLLYEFLNIFNDLNIEVYEPFERTKHIIKKEGNWAYDLAASNLYDLEKCDCIFAIINGTPPDEGVPRGRGRRRRRGAPRGGQVHAGDGRRARRRAPAAH